MVRIVLIVALLVSVRGFAQEQRLISQLKISETAPAELLSSRSAVLFSNAYKQDELNRVQAAFQQIGIDADLYFDVEKVLAGIDTERSYSAYLTTREIKFLIILTKGADGYSFYFTEYSNTIQFVAKDAIAWKMTDKKIDELMTRIYRDSWLREKKQNFLINDIPEMDITIPIITGRRSELFPIDLKIDMLAIPKFDDPNIQSQVDTLFKKMYPYPDKFKVATIPADEKELVKQGFQYALIYVKANGKSAHELLGYDMQKTAATAYGSVTYPGTTTPVVKAISADLPVYKFYIKHLRSGNVFLGTKWDADEDLFAAMRNHIMGFRTVLNLN